MTGDGAEPGPAEVRHAALWAALDTIAASRGLTPSGLARAAGLDPTTFNTAKRYAPGGRPRWPGTEGLLKALAAVEITLEQFARVAQGAQASLPDSQSVMTPVIDFSRLAEPGIFSDTGLPCGTGWEEWHPAPPHLGPRAFAVRIDTAGLAPFVRPGSLLVLAPGATVRPGDRALLMGAQDTPSTIVLRARGHDAVVVAPFSGEAGEHTLKLADIRWMHRIAMLSF